MGCPRATSVLPRPSWPVSEQSEGPGLLVVHKSFQIPCPPSSGVSPSRPLSQLNGCSQPHLTFPYLRQFLFLYKWKKRLVLSPLASRNAVPLATRSGRFQSRDRRKGQYHLGTRRGSPRTAGVQPDETLRPGESLLSPLSSGRTVEGVEWFVCI